MVYNDDVYRKKSQQLIQNVLKTVNLELMLQYLKPNERKSLYCILNDEAISDDCLNYQNLNEYAEYYDNNFNDINSAIDIDSFVKRFLKQKNLNYEYIIEYPYGLYLDLKDRFKKGIYLYTKIKNNKIYQALLSFDFSQLKDYYFNYEKVLTDNFFNMLDEKNLYFNLIFIQGILTEIKDKIITFPSANISLINSVLLSKIYDMMLKISQEKQALFNNKISDAIADYITHAITDSELKKAKIIDKFKEEGIIYKEKLKACEDKIKLLTKKNDEKLINQIYDDIRKKELENANLKDMLIKKADEQEKKIDSLNSKIYSISLEKEKLLNKIKELEMQNSKLQVKLCDLKKESSIISTSELKEYIDKHMEKIYNIFSAYNEENNQHKTSESTETVSESQSFYRIGYATLTRSSIELVTQSGRYPINNIPDQSLIGEGQFVRVDKDNNFINTYTYYSSYDIQFHLYPDCKFGVIHKENEAIYIDFGNNLILSANKDNMKFYEGQIVLADSLGNIKILFKKLHFNLDYFYEITKVRRMEFWRVLSIIDDKCIIENIDKGNKEIFIIPSNYTIKNNEILLKKGDVLINVFSFKFYAHSRYYKKTVSGIAEVKDDMILLVKVNGEKVIVNAPINMQEIESGDLITVDEFNNIIKYEKVNSNIERSKIKTGNNMVGVSDKYKVKSIIIKKRILIIGNPTYQQSYKLNFLKNGYQAEVVDGYSSWSRVQKYIKNKDFIVIITNYVSHDNMWQVKDNIKDIPVIYSETDGANRIIELIENSYSEDESEQLNKAL